MIDRLVIKFVKLEKALVAQQLEIKASNNLDNKYEDNHVLFHSNGIDFADDAVWISKLNSPRVAVRMFDTNTERDEYLDKVVKWISDEQFTNGGSELKVGDMCKFRDKLEGEWCEGRLITILPAKYKFRYIFETQPFDCRWSFARYARLLAQRVEPKIDGDIYTWRRTEDGR